MSEPKKPQPAPLRLANAQRSLRAKARKLTDDTKRFYAGDFAVSQAYLDALEEEHERAALVFARAAYDCNNQAWAGLLDK